MKSVDILVLTNQDLNKFMQLIKVFEEVFEMVNFTIPNENHLQNLLDKEDFLVFVALENGEVVGGLTAYVLQQYYVTKPLAYIYDLAVKKSFQRRGIGQRLMAEVKRYCTKAGMEEVFVQANTEDNHAVDFYHSTGGIPEEVIHFNYPLENET